MRALFALLLPVTFTSLLGCTSAEASFKAERAALETQYRPGISAVSERLEKARQAALAKPPLKKPSGAWAGPPLVAANGGVPNANAIVMVLRAGSCETALPKDEPFRFCGANSYCMEREPRESKLDFESQDKASLQRILEYTKQHLAEAAAVRYAVFVETLEAKPPVPKFETFKEGTYRATARVYDLEGTKYLGGFEVGSTSDNVVGYGGSRSGVKSELSRDYRDNAAEAWNKALRDFSGGTSRLELGYVFEWE